MAENERQRENKETDEDEENKSHERKAHQRAHTYTHTHQETGKERQKTKRNKGSTLLHVSSRSIQPCPPRSPAFASPGATSVGCTPERIVLESEAGHADLRGHNWMLATDGTGFRGLSHWSSMGVVETEGNAVDATFSAQRVQGGMVGNGSCVLGILAHSTA